MKHSRPDLLRPRSLVASQRINIPVPRETRRCKKPIKTNKNDFQQKQIHVGALNTGKKISDVETVTLFSCRFFFLHLFFLFFLVVFVYKKKKKKNAKVCFRFGFPLENRKYRFCGRRMGRCCDGPTGNIIKFDLELRLDRLMSDQEKVFEQ